MCAVAIRNASSYDLVRRVVFLRSHFVVNKQSKTMVTVNYWTVFGRMQINTVEKNLRSVATAISVRANQIFLITGFGTAHHQLALDTSSSEEPIVSDTCLYTAPPGYEDAIHKSSYKNVSMKLSPLYARTLFMKYELLTVWSVVDVFNPQKNQNSLSIWRILPSPHNYYVTVCGCVIGSIHGACSIHMWVDRWWEACVIRVRVSCVCSSSSPFVDCFSCSFAAYMQILVCWYDRICVGMSLKIFFSVPSVIWRWWYCICYVYSCRFVRFHFVEAM